MKLARALRWLALTIAVLAVIDPAIAARRRADAVVAVLHGESALDSAAADAAVRELDGRFTVIRAPFPAASATVIAGTALPRGAQLSGGPAFAVVPDPMTAYVAIAAVRAPARVPLQARADIAVDIAASSNDSVDVSLLDGDVVLDRAAVAARSRTRARVTLAYVPARAGRARLRVQAAVRGAQTSARTDVTMDVTTAPWSVLFTDARPSWMSTFVRRSLEQDPRFSVTSRTVTSRELATEYGRPPRALADSAGLAAFGAVIVGAPDALTAAEVAALEHYMRTRGGAVLLLLDRRAAGAWERLAQVQQWQYAAGTPQPLAATIAGLRAGELTWPATAPPLARAVATHSRTGAPVVWRMAVGGGTLVVSGALDAWRYRDPAVASFDAFWRTLIGGLAEAAPPPVSVTLSPALARPGEWLDVTVTARDAALVSPQQGSVRVIATAALDSMLIQLWPATSPGELRGRVRAPGVAGEYRLVASAGDETSAATLLVSGDATHAIAGDADLMRAWAASRGGAAMDAGSLENLADSVAARLGGTVRRERWHPMRSAWWLVPFVLALGGEWLIRRRRGLL